MSDWNNPFQHPLLNGKAQNFAATSFIPGEMPVEIDLRKNKTKSRDPRMFSKDIGYTPSLCGSKHAVWIGIQPPPTGGPNKIVPFENNIVVAFWANDTSGGGILDPGAVLGGLGVLITDPKHYEKTVATGLDIVNDNYANCADEKGGWNCKGEFAEAAAYNSVYIATVPVRLVGNALNYMFEDSVTTIWNKSPTVNKIKKWKIWGAESKKSFATDYLGLDYHNVGASAHKVSIEITCRHNGVTRVVHDTELAGTSELYAGNQPSPALAYFVIDSPGQWKVRVKSMASGSCADPRLDVVETFTVASPPSPDESAAESHSALADRKITAPLVGLGATVLAYGLYKWYNQDTDAAWLEYGKKV